MLHCFRGHYFRYMSHTFTPYELHEIVGPMIKTNILQYTRLDIKIVEAKILFGQRL